MAASCSVPDERPARVLFLGSGRVGKTSILKRFLDDTFDEKYQPTVEDLYQRTYEVREHVAHLEFMDTSGTYDFPAMRQVWIKAASAFVLVFAQNDLYSFDYVQRLLTQIREERVDYDTLPFVAVCNKVDLPVREKTFADGSIELWVSETGLKSSQFVYASCKTNSAVTDIFEKLWEQNSLTWKIVFQPCLSPPVNDSFTNSTRRRFSALLDNSQTLVHRGGVSPSRPIPGSQQVTSRSMSSSGAVTLSPTVANSKTSKGLFNRFGSQKRQSLRMKSSKQQKGNRTQIPPIKLDCVIS